MGMLHYDFMIRALIAGLITGLICPALGVFSGTAPLFIYG